MPKEVWLTILGGFLSGVVGIILFFIQRWKDKRDEQQDILFRSYQLLFGPITFRGDGIDAFHVQHERRSDVRALCFLLKDKGLARDIYQYAGLPPHLSPEEMQRRILSKLDKKLYQDLAQLKPGADKSISTK